MDDRWEEFFWNAPENLENLMQGRDYLYRLLHTIDWDMQLIAIRGMLRRNREAMASVDQEIAESRAATDAYNGPHHDHYIDEHVYMLQQSVYTEAAVSMAAIGMVAPMVESVFAEAFRELGKMYVVKNRSPGDHKRWTRADEHKDRWNVQVYFDSKREAKSNIILGLPQIAEAVGLNAHIDSETWKWLDAMLQYRNYMFHGGLEWSEENREKFQTLIETQGWEKYFDKSTTNDAPWIFYIRADAIDDIPNKLEAVLDGLAAFAKSLPFDLISIDR